MRAILCLLVFATAAASLSAAETPAQEIEFLVRYISEANVQFFRSGKEYSAQEGAEHMRKKLARAGDRVKTAEEFITGIATKSYLTGGTYKVKLASGKTVETGPWLTEALTTHRQSATRR